MPRRGSAQAMPVRVDLARFRSNAVRAVCATRHRSDCAYEKKSFESKQARSASVTRRSAGAQGLSATLGRGTPAAPAAWVLVALAA
jgi:hypothetical protein